MKLHKKILVSTFFILQSLSQLNFAIVPEDLRDTFLPLKEDFRSLSILPGYLAKKSDLMKNYFRFVNANDETRKLMEMLFNYFDEQLKVSGLRFAKRLDTGTIISILKAINNHRTEKNRESLKSSIEALGFSSKSGDSKNFIRSLLGSLTECGYFTESDQVYTNNFTETLLLTFLSMKIKNKAELAELFQYLQDNKAIVQRLDLDAKFKKEDLEGASCSKYLNELDKSIELICYLYLESTNSSYPEFVQDCKILPTFFYSQIGKEKQDAIQSTLPMNCMESAIRNLFNFIIKDKGTNVFNLNKLWSIYADRSSPGVKFYEQNLLTNSAIANVDAWNETLQNIPEVYYERRIKTEGPKESPSLILENSCACNPPYDKPSYFRGQPDSWTYFGAMPQGEDVIESNFLKIINHLFWMNLSNLETLQSLLKEKLNISMTWTIGDPIKIVRENSKGESETIIFKNAKGKEHREMIITFTKLQDNSTCVISLKPTHAQAFFGKEEIKNCEVVQQISDYISHNIIHASENPNIRYLMCLCPPSSDALDKVMDAKTFIYGCMTRNLENNDTCLDTIFTILNFIKRSAQKNIHLVLPFLENLVKKIGESSLNTVQIVRLVHQIICAKELDTVNIKKLIHKIIDKLSDFKKLEFIQNSCNIPELLQLSISIMETIPTEINNCLKKFDVKQTVELLKTLGALRCTNLDQLISEFIISDKLSIFIAENKDDTLGATLDTLKSDLLSLISNEALKQKIDSLITTSDTDLDLFS